MDKLEKNILKIVGIFANISAVSWFSTLKNSKLFPENIDFYNENF